MSKLVEGVTMDEERALYGARGVKIVNCKFDGPADGESALKEAGDLDIDSTYFNLRYPLWHVTNTVINECQMTEFCRAALWYDENITINNSILGGIKALRECKDIKISGSKINSCEFGWKCNNINISSTDLTSEYPFFESKNMEFVNFTMKGKYSFQYTENIVIRNSFLDTKDAFWHSSNVTVIDSVVKGEYLAWYANNIKFVRCKIIGTQPFCYTHGLILEDCTMEGADFAFEFTDVQATIHSSIISVKNPISGRIEADSIGEIIYDEFKKPESNCEIITKQ